MIDLGIGYEQAEKDSRPQPIPDGTYEFNVISIDDITTHAGRPGWRWWLQVINRPDLGSRRLPYNVYFPWDDPSTGQRDTGGLGFLVSIMDGIGARWAGTALPEKETFFGKNGVMKVGTRIRKQNPADPDEEGVPENTVRIVTKRSGKGVVA